LNRFQTWERNITLDEAQDESGPVDLFAPVRSYVEGFNIRRKEVITPGPAITVDESGSRWRYRKIAIIF
jgi:hypothetical protein